MPLILDAETKPIDLHGRLDRLRQRVRFTAVSSGVVSLLAIVGVFIAPVVIADAYVHLPAPLRAGLLVALIVGIAYGIRRLIVQPWRAADDEHALALQVERHVPGLHDSLASAVQFGQDDSTSSALRAATAHFAVERTRGVDFAEIPQGKSMAQPLLALLATVVALFLLARGGFGHALVRLIDPYGQHPWPTKTLLTVTAAEMIARGEPFELNAKLGGVPTDRLVLSLAADRAPTVDHPYVVSADDSNVRIRLEPSQVSRSFRYRVTAGDADTGWRSVAVTVPPELVPLDGRPTPQVHLVYPTYTDLPQQNLPDGTGGIEAVFGTVMHIRAAPDRPIHRASLRWLPTNPQAIASLVSLTFADSRATTALGTIPVLHALTVPMPFAIATDRLRFANDFTPLISGPYEMTFVDAAGLAGRRTFDIRILPDPAPTVVLDHPYSGGEGMELMLSASFALQAVVEDVMFAVRRVRLEYRTRPSEPPRSISIYDGDALGAALPQLLSLGPAGQMRLRPVRLVIDRRMSLSSFRHADGKPLAIGDVLTIALVAEDFDDVSPGKPPGRSHDVEIKIVGRDRFEARLNQARSDIVKMLSELHRLQSDALDLSATAEQARRSTGQLTPEDRNRVARSESLQQQVRERMGDDRDGLRAAAERLRQTMADNPGASPTIRAQAERLVSELERLSREVIEPINPLLSSARQETETVPPVERSSGALPEAVKRQRDAERGFRDLLDQMLSGQAVAALAADAAALASEQQQLTRQRAELVPHLPPGADPKSLPDADQKALNQLKERQEQLARRAETFAHQLDTQAAAAAKAADAEQLRSRTLDDAIGDTRDPRKAGELRRESEKAADKADALRQEAEALNEARQAIRDGDNGAPLSEQMNRAADALGRNRMSEAQQRQDAANQQLDRVRDALRDSDIPEGERLVKERRRAEQQVEKLVKDQESLQDRTLAAEKQTDQLSKKKQMEELAREEEQLAERATDMARQLRREGQNAAARELERAAGNMDQARSQLERGQSASSEQDDALEKLDDAAEQTRRDRKEAEDRLLREKLLKLADRLKGIGDRHGNFAAETNRLFDAAKLAGGWSRAMQKSFSDVGREQEALGKELTELAKNNLAKYKVVQRLAEQAASAMADAAAAIEEAKASGLTKENNDTDRAAVRAPQEQARKQIAQLVDAITAPREDTANGRLNDRNDEGGRSGQNRSNNAKPDEDAIPPLAQLKILRQMQADLNERTADFARLNPDPTKWTPSQKSAIDKLRRAQVELAELFIEVAPATEPPGEKP
jgi:hypothetical protein